MYDILLIIHSLLRWVVLGSALFLLYKTYTGWKSSSAFDAQTQKVYSALIGSLHTQLLLGLILYFVFSPIVQGALADMASTMKNSVLRFWAVEHITGMIIAIALIQFGKIRTKKIESDTQKHKTAFIYTLIGFLIIMATIPWGVLNTNIVRPLFRF